MNGFGDESSTLEDNPFANPFAGSASASADPWADPYQAGFQEEFDTQAAFGGESATGFSPEPEEDQQEAAPETEIHTAREPVQQKEQDKSDPLDHVGLAAAEDVEQEQELPESATTPGFKEAGAFSQTATIRPTAPEEYDPPHHSPSPPPPVVDLDPTPSADSDLPGPHSGWGPLNQKPPVIDTTFPNLVLGGETSAGGWHTEQNSASWSNEPSTYPTFTTQKDSFNDDEDDSDDDRPIGEIMKRTGSVCSTFMG